MKNDNPGAKKVDPDSKEEVAEQETPTSAPSTASKPSSQQSPKVDIPGLNLSKSQEKKMKQMKKKKEDKKEDDDNVWQSLNNHPVFNAQKGANNDTIDKKRNATAANLSPQDKILPSKGKKNPKTE